VNSGLVVTGLSRSSCEFLHWEQAPPRVPVWSTTLGVLPIKTLSVCFPT